MGKHEKLVNKLLAKPKSFTYAETVTIFCGFGYVQINNGKTSGSSVSFFNSSTGAVFTMHKPHPEKEIKRYVVKNIIDHLKEYNEL